MLQFAADREPGNAETAGLLYDAYLRSGRALLRAEKLTEAIDRFESARKLRPNDPDAVEGVRLATIQLLWQKMEANWTDNIGEAMRALQELASIDPKDPRVADKLYALQMRDADQNASTGNVSRAIQVLEAALKTQPDRVEAPERLVKLRGPVFAGRILFKLVPGVSPPNGTAEGDVLEARIDPRTAAVQVKRLVSRAREVVFAPATRRIIFTTNGATRLRSLASEDETDVLSFAASCLAASPDGQRFSFRRQVDGRNQLDVSDLAGKVSTIHKATNAIYFNSGRTLAYDIGSELGCASWISNQSVVLEGRIGAMPQTITFNPSFGTTIPADSLIVVGMGGGVTPMSGTEKESVIATCPARSAMLTVQEGKFRVRATGARPLVKNVSDCENCPSGTTFQDVPRFVDDTCQLLYVRRGLGLFVLDPFADGGPNVLYPAAGPGWTPSSTFWIGLSESARVAVFGAAIAGVDVVDARNGRVNGPHVVGPGTVMPLGWVPD